jgi:preprotein translocase subunit YajC
VNGLEQVLPFVLIAVVFWFLLIRPQRRRQMELMSTQRRVQVGDEVLLGAGIVGVVEAADDDYLHLGISPGVRMKVTRQAVVRILTESSAGSSPDEDGPDRDGGTSPPTHEGA